MRKVGPQSYLKKGLYALRPALYLWVSQDDWADAAPVEEMHAPKLALVESAHPGYAEELFLSHSTSCVPRPMSGTGGHLKG